MHKNDKPNLLAILDSIIKIGTYTENITSTELFYNDTKSFDAVLMNFVAIGEMVARISDELKNQYTQIEWNMIKDFRNLIAHDYLGIDAEEVWQIIKNHLPSLEIQIRDILFKI
jgi:uncharacterized protein with HEPN domain